MRRTLLLFLVGLGLFATMTAMPANAASFEWKDPSGDAHFFVNSALPPVPTPNEPSLDVTIVKMEVVKDALVWTAAINKIGATNPPGSTGVGYQFALKYAAAAGTIQVYDDVLIGKATEFRAAAVGASTGTVACGKCVGIIDRKNSKVVLTTPLSSLYSALRSADKAAPPFKPGAKLTGLAFSTRRLYSVGQPGAYGSQPFTSDTSAPVGDAGFTF